VGYVVAESFFFVNNTIEVGYDRAIVLGLIVISNANIVVEDRNSLGT
jgi:hypothetical protein